MNVENIIFGILMPLCIISVAMMISLTSHKTWEVIVFALIAAWFISNLIDGVKQLKSK